MNLRLYCLLLLFPGMLLSATGSVSRLVRTGDELNEALDQVAPGTTIQLAGGEWIDVVITISKSGAADKPIVVEAESPGLTVLTGKCAISLGGDYIEVRNLHFRQAVRADGAEALISFRDAAKREASNCRITGVYFEDCNPEDPLMDYPWIRMYGHRNRVDHCRFSGQEHKGRAIQVRVYVPDPAHRIDHNYFLDRPPGLESNGYEIIQIGLSGDSMKPGNVVVENNFFSRCDGETEIISSKSYGNIIRNNLFLECSGSVTLRHGNAGIVRDNVFIGRGKPSSGGVRVIGTDHRIEGNLFSGLTGRTGGVVVLYCGIPDSPLNGYFAADRAIVQNNTFHENTGNALYLNAGFGQRNRVLLPDAAAFIGNVFGRPAAEGTVAVAGSLTSVVFADNVYGSGVELGRPVQDGFVPADIACAPNSQGLPESILSKDGIAQPAQTIPSPELPSPDEVGPAWKPALPELLLVNSSRLATLEGHRLQKLLASAEAVLSAGRIYSVTTNDQTPPSGDRHDYYSTGPYWWPNPDTPNGLPYVRIDGKFNPERDRVSDRDPLLGMIHDVQTMAWAHAASGDQRFANWGAKLLRAWFLDPNSRMNPNLNHAQAIPGITEGRGTGIIDTHPFSELVDALVILQATNALTPDESRSLFEWFSHYTDWLLSSKNGQDEQAARNNHGTAFDLQVAALLWYTGQSERLKQYLREYTLPRIEEQIEPDGSQPHELARTRTWSYCTENLEHFFKLGLIGHKVDLDLFACPSPGRPALRAALDYVLPYVCDPGSWPHAQKTAWQDTFIRPVLGIATSAYQDTRYKQTLDCLEEGDLHAYLVLPRPK